MSPAQLLLLLVAEEVLDCSLAMGSRMVWRRDCLKRLGPRGACVAPCAAAPSIRWFSSMLCTDNMTGNPRQRRCDVTNQFADRLMCYSNYVYSSSAMTVRTSYVVTTANGVTLICVVTSGNRHSHAGSVLQTAAVQCVNPLFSPHQHLVSMHRLTWQGRAVKLVSISCSLHISTKSPCTDSHGKAGRSSL